jgi:hypothetical protein
MAAVEILPATGTCQLKNGWPGGVDGFQPREESAEHKIYRAPLLGNFYQKANDDRLSLIFDLIRSCRDADIDCNHRCACGFERTYLAANFPSISPAAQSLKSRESGRNRPQRI